ncbi:MAG TPA: helix-turn-helix domain-containing protein [Nitrososphaeraceae archaeon]
MRLISDLIRITRQEAADMISRSKRQVQRVVKRFREEGIRGLRFISKRPHNSMTAFFILVFKIGEP